jgi:hypothetical protein
LIQQHSNNWSRHQKKRKLTKSWHRIVIFVKLAAQLLKILKMMRERKLPRVEVSLPTTARHLLRWHSWRSVSKEGNGHLQLVSRYLLCLVLSKNSSKVSSSSSDGSPKGSGSSRGGCGGDGATFLLRPSIVYVMISCRGIFLASEFVQKQRQDVELYSR